MFNLWNWHIFNESNGNAGYPVDYDINSSTFGMWNGSVTNPRNIQVGVRLGFCPFRSCTRLLRPGETRDNL